MVFLCDQSAQTDLTLSNANSTKKKNLTNPKKLDFSDCRTDLDCYPKSDMVSDPANPN